MKVEVMEVGQRPLILSAARRDAPQAARRMGEIMAPLDIADEFYVVIDWDNSLGMIAPGAMVIPVMHIELAKYVPEVGKTLSIESRLDIDEVFGAHGVLTGNLLQDITMELVEKLALALRGIPSRPIERVTV